MDMSNLNKTLGEIAVTGVFQGAVLEAQTIVRYLRQEQVNEVSLLSLQAFLLFSQQKYTDAVALLAPWCASHSPDVPHSLFAMNLWCMGQQAQAEQCCRDVIEQAEDPGARKLAQDVLTQLGG